jgi:hypothetical protein
MFPLAAVTALAVIPAAVDGATVVQLVIGGFGLTGIIGAAIALFKLRPEVNQMAVTSTQAAAGEWQKLYDAKAAELAHCEQEIAALRKRAEAAEDALAKARRQRR